MMSTVSQSKPETVNLGDRAGFTFDHDCSDLTSVTSHAHDGTNHGWSKCLELPLHTLQHQNVRVHSLSVLPSC